jgi:hypothetical protein
MEFRFDVAPSPVSEVCEERVLCCDCKSQLVEDAYFDGEDKYYCESCIQKLIDKTIHLAEGFAQQNCKILKPLPPYDPDQEYQCTPEDYELGYRYSYTPNSHMCKCRHEFTNYDDLIKPLSKDLVVHQIYYHAIREKIMELLEAVIDYEEP